MRPANPNASGELFGQLKAGGAERTPEVIEAGNTMRKGRAK